MKKKSLLFILLFVVLFAVVGCGDKKEESSEESTSESVLTKALVYDYPTISAEYKANAAKASDYNKKYYVFYGTINTIGEDYLLLKNEVSGSLKVYLKKSVLKDLNKDEQISVVGKIDDVSIETPEMKSAEIVSQSELEDLFIIDMVKEKGTRYPNYTYSKYKYDKNGRAVEYAVKGDSTGTYTLTYDDKGNLIDKTLAKYSGKEVYKYTYDENNNLVSETQTDYNSDGEILRDNTFNINVELDSEGRIIKKTEVNKNDSDYSYVYTYEYKDGKLVKETEYDHHSNTNITSEYKYDSYGYMISKSTTGDSYNTVKYVYSIVAKK